MGRTSFMSFALYTPVNHKYNGGMYPNDPYGQQPAPQPQPQPGVPQTPFGQPVPQPTYAPGQPAVAPASNFIVPPRKPSKVWLILAIVFIVLTLAAAGVAVWAYINYLDQKNNVDSKVSTAVTTAVKAQADKDAAAFLEKEKQPNRQFVGPDDYGRVSFDYPKTWSVYVAQDASRGGTYEAYFNPVLVPAVSQVQQYSLRVTIENRDYDQSVEMYKDLVARGSLKSTAVSADELSGTRFDGSFTQDIVGSAVLFKIRDKTVTIRTDAQVFAGDFDALIKTITFNK